MHHDTFCCCARQIALWTAGFVLLTLCVNAPMIPWLLKVTAWESRGNQRMGTGSRRHADGRTRN
jgi:NhaP-type Na+/H+ or K+/H+ antiporter